MATIIKHFASPNAPDRVWAVFADTGAVHTRLAPGFVTDTRLEAGARVVTFVNGFVARETIVTVDPAARRLVYSAAGGSLTHHNASFQVEPDGAGGSTIRWTADLLPEAAAETVGAMMDHGAAAMTKALAGDVD